MISTVACNSLSKSLTRSSARSATAYISHLNSSSKSLVNPTLSAPFRIAMASVHNIPETQTAFVYRVGKFELEKKEIPVPKPDPGKVLLKIAAAGVCHSDLHVLEGGLPYPDGIVLGHEIAGHIAAYGEGVDKSLYPQDSLYAVVGPNPCGLCKDCRNGRDNLCLSPTRKHMGLGAPGGYEQYTQIVPRNLTKVPKGIPPEIAAASTDAVLTPYHALKNAKINGTSRILIIGLGGLGINGVQIAKIFGAYTIATDPKESSRQLAKEFGADEVYDTLPEDLGVIDVVADFVGSQSTLKLSEKYLKSGGRILPIGLHDPNLTFDLNSLAFKEFIIQGNFWGTSQDQEEVFALVSQGRITPQVETTSYLNVNDVLRELRDGHVKSRRVLVHE